MISTVWISLYSKSGGIMILCEHAHLTPLSTVNNTWAQVYILNFPAILTSHTKIIQNVLFIFCLCKHNDNYSSAWQQNVGYESCVFCNKLLLLSHSFTYVMIFFFFFYMRVNFSLFQTFLARKHEGQRFVWHSRSPLLLPLTFGADGGLPKPVLSLLHLHTWLAHICKILNAI